MESQGHQALGLEYLSLYISCHPATEIIGRIARNLLELFQSNVLPSQWDADMTPRKRTSTVAFDNTSEHVRKAGDSDSHFLKRTVT